MKASDIKMSYVRVESLSEIRLPEVLQQIAAE
jgi:hypothetical protein